MDGIGCEQQTINQETIGPTLPVKNRWLTFLMWSAAVSLLPCMGAAGRGSRANIECYVIDVIWTLTDSLDGFT